MIFINRDAPVCNCGPAPGLPIRPGLSAPTEPIVTFNPTGGFSFSFGRYEKASDAPEVKLAVFDLDGRLVSGDFAPATTAVTHEGDTHEIAVAVDPGFVTAAGTFQIVVYGTADNAVLFTAWLVRTPVRLALELQDGYQDQNIGGLVATRAGTVTLSTAQYVDIVFATPFSSADYTIPTREVRYTLGGDPPAIIVPANVSNKTATGFRQWFIGTADSDFVFDYVAAL